MNTMRMTVLAMMLLLAGAARGKEAVATRPASGPSTRASTIDQAKARVDAAETAAETERAAARRRAEENPAFKVAAAEVEARLKILEAVRENGAAQEKLDASAAFNKARAVADQIRDGEIKRDTKLAAANKELSAALYELSDLERGEAMKASANEQRKADEHERELKKDPGYRAAKEGRFVLGMTSKQAYEALGNAGMSMYADAKDTFLGHDGKEHSRRRWNLNSPGPHALVFEDDKLVRISE